MNDEPTDVARRFDHGWLEAFPHARIESMRMTTAGDLPATGAVFEAPCTSRFEIEDGRIKVQRLLFAPDFVPLRLSVR